MVQAFNSKVSRIKDRQGSPLPTVSLNSFYNKLSLSTSIAWGVFLSASWGRLCQKFGINHVHRIHFSPNLGSSCGADMFSGSCFGSCFDNYLSLFTFTQKIRLKVPHGFGGIAGIPALPPPPLSLNTRNVSPARCWTVSIFTTKCRMLLRKTFQRPAWGTVGGHPGAGASRPLHVLRERQLERFAGTNIICNADRHSPVCAWPKCANSAPCRNRDYRKLDETGDNLVRAATSCCA
jgi:hypothetical protein